MPNTFAYSFSVWPSETWGFERQVFDLFRLYDRVEMAFSEPEFERFRSALNHAGLTLREVERESCNIPSQSKPS